MITVLGATGNVGGKVAQQLLDQNQKVRVVGRDAQKLAKMHPGAEIAAGDLNDSQFLATALKGSDAAFVMIPPNYAAPSFAEVYRLASESIVKALKGSGVKHVVNLSSLGADLADGTGPIKFLNLHEQRLNKLDAVNVLHLRPAYFFENLLSNSGLIKEQSIMGSHIDGDAKLAMIATADIAGAAVDGLVAREFKGKSVQELLGPKDLTMTQAAVIISEIMGKPVKYIAFDAPSTIGALKSFGFSQNSAELFVEMSEAINTASIKNHRDESSTTATKFEDFAQIFRT